MTLLQVPEIYIVIPMLNEEKGILPTCEALMLQEGNFGVIFVDNSSEDNSVWTVEKFIVDNRLKDWHIIVERQKGTGAAADTGVKYAISLGAKYIARTDADCIPADGWVFEAVKTLKKGFHLVAGRMVTRVDDIPVNWFDEKILNTLPTVARLFGKFRPSNKGTKFLGPYMMTPGCNVAFTKEIYEESGGFPRTKIEDVHEDRALINNVRRVTSRYVYNNKMVVAMSARRVKAWGILNTLRWYKDHGYRPDKVDIR